MLQSDIHTDYIRDFIVSFDNRFIFSDLSEGYGSDSESIESTRLTGGALISVSTNVTDPIIENFVAIVTDEQLEVLLDYWKKKKTAMLFFEHKNNSSRSYKYSQANIASNPLYTKSSRSMGIANIYVTLQFHCSSREVM